MKKLIRDYLLQYLMITAGAILAAFALEEFLVPNTVLDGGITGISIILNQLTLQPISIFIIVLNLPFLLLGFQQLGKRFFVSGIYGMVIFTVFLEVFAEFQNATSSELLAVVFGGCLDGSEVVAMIVSKRSNFSTGQVIFGINVVIYIVAGFLFGWDRAMYSLLTYFISFKVIDMVEEGLEQAKAAMIITDHSGLLADMIYQRLGRTCTILEGEGLISGKKVVLYCVLTRLEINELKRIIKEYDGSAFVTISDVSEIIGRHIKSSSGTAEQEETA